MFQVTVTTTTLPVTVVHSGSLTSIITVTIAPTCMGSAAAFG